MEQENNNEAKRFAERMVEFRKIYEEALRKRYVTSKKQFAEFIGVAYTTTSSAYNGNPKHLTEGILIKAEQALAKREAEEQAKVLSSQIPPMPQPIGTTKEAPDAPASEDIKGEDLRAIVHEVCACVNNMCDTLNKERESHERIITSMLEAFKR